MSSVPLVSTSRPLWLHPAAASDLPAIAALETMSYPADEAASPESLAYRLANAGEYFYGVYGARAAAEDEASGGEELVGFICATVAASATLTHEAMETHDPRGSSLCIHSVVTAPACRRQGIARAALKAYAEIMADAHGKNWRDMDML